MLVAADRRRAGNLRPSTMIRTVDTHWAGRSSHDVRRKRTRHDKWLKPLIAPTRFRVRRYPRALRARTARRTGAELKIEQSHEQQRMAGSRQDYGAPRHDRVRLYRKRHAVAAGAPFRVRPLALRCHRSQRRGPRAPRCEGIRFVHAAVTVVADRFCHDVLGFDVAVDYPGATFYGSGVHPGRPG